MLEIVGDMWKEGVNYDAVCITTNGFVKKNGEAVMGRGCAKEAAGFWWDIPHLLGDLIGDNGNVVQKLKVVMLPPGLRCAPFTPVQLISFPVKPVEMPMTPQLVNTQVVVHMRDAFRFKRMVPGWACVAQLSIIKDSAHQLVELIHKINERSAFATGRILLPRPGCGAGELRWEDVRPILSEILDDRFTVITRKQ